MIPSMGERIKELRNKRGFTQDDMAEKLNMNRANFSNYERNLSIPPSNTLAKIADILGTTTDYLLCRTDDPLPKLEESNKPISRIYDAIARAQELPEEDMEEVAETLDALIKLRLKKKQGKKS